jgi:phage gp36-like protein
MLLFCHRTANAIRLLNLLLYAAVSVLNEHNATCVSTNLHAVYGVASHLSCVLRSLSLVDASREVDSYVVGRSRNHLLVVVHSLSVHAVSVSVVSLRLSELSEGVACLLLNLLRVVEEGINAVASLQVLSNLDLVDDERIVVLPGERRSRSNRSGGSSCSVLCRSLWL